MKVLKVFYWKKLVAPSKYGMINQIQEKLKIFYELADITSDGLNRNKELDFLGGGGFDIEEKLIAMMSNLSNISKP